MANRNVILAALLRVPLFAGLKPLQITEIGRHAERIKFPAGGIVVRAGEPLDGAYLIVHGDAERETPSTSTTPALCESVEPGSLIGELAMFVDYKPLSTIRCVGRVNCLKLTRAGMLEQMEGDPALARHFEDIYLERLQRAAAEAREVDRLLEKAAAA